MKAVEIVLLVVWNAVLSRHPHRSISPGALRVRSWHDPVDREILPSSGTLIAQAKGTSDSGFSLITDQLFSGKRKNREPFCFL